jgi:ribA/ribD-fused uncharacterized protein
MILPSDLDKYRNSEYLPFYSHNDRFGDKAVFSNFYPAKFTIDGIEFNCSEQYMMYKKAELFNDTFIANKILSIDNPVVIKACGRQVKKFDKDIWEENSLSIVTKGCYAKFSQNIRLKNILLDTKDKLLIEATKNDYIWGIGFNVTDFRVVSREEWGKNWLGICLMRVRDILKAEK